MAVWSQARRRRSELHAARSMARTSDEVLERVRPCIGHSSPIVAGDRAYLFSRVGEQEVLTAFDVASGKQVWRQGYDAPYQMNPAATSHGKGPKSTRCWTAAGSSRSASAADPERMGPGHRQGGVAARLREGVLALDA